MGTPTTTGEEVTTPNDNRLIGEDNDNQLQDDDNRLRNRRDGRKDDDGSGIRRSRRSGGKPATLVIIGRNFSLTFNSSRPVGGALLLQLLQILRSEVDTDEKYY